MLERIMDVRTLWVFFFFLFQDRVLEIMTMFYHIRINIEKKEREVKVQLFKY